MLSLVLHETEVLLVAESIDSRIDEISDILASTDSELNDVALTGITSVNFRLFVLFMIK